MRLPAATGAMSLAVLLAACGGHAHNGRQARVTASRTVGGSASTVKGHTHGGYRHEDGDSDDRYPASQHIERDDLNLLGPYGPPIARKKSEVIAGVVKRYYRAWATQDATAVCSMLDRTLAIGLDNGGQPSPSNATCAAAVKPLIASHPARPTGEAIATMVVTSVHVAGNMAMAVTGFRAMPERAILLERESGTWKLASLFDTSIP